MPSAYLASTVSSLVCPGFIMRFGGIRASQIALLGIGIGLGLATIGIIGAVIISALVLGCVYAMPIPAGAHVLARHTPPPPHKLAFSVRHSGVSVGGLPAVARLTARVLAVGPQVSVLCVAVAALCSVRVSR